MSDYVIPVDFRINSDKELAAFLLAHVDFAKLGGDSEYIRESENVSPELLAKSKKEKNVYYTRTVHAQKPVFLIGSQLEDGSEVEEQWIGSRMQCTINIQRIAPYVPTAEKVETPEPAAPRAAMTFGALKAKFAK